MINYDGLGLIDGCKHNKKIRSYSTMDPNNIYCISIINYYSNKYFFNAEIS